MRRAVIALLSALVAVLLFTPVKSRVQEALERTMAGRTTVVVAHRLSTIVHADRVLVLDRAEVLRRCDAAGLFLWARSAAG